jgi:hypothetical protein
MCQNGAKILKKAPGHCPDLTTAPDIKELF